MQLQYQIIAMRIRIFNIFLLHFINFIYYNVNTVQQLEHRAQQSKAKGVLLKNEDEIIGTGA